MKKRNCVHVIVLVLLLVSIASAKFVAPTYAPVDRLIKNAGAYIQENPDNAEGYYILARVHYMAFINRVALAPTTGGDSPPRIAPGWLSGDFASQVRSQQATSVALEELGFSAVSEIPQEKRKDFEEARSKKSEQLENEGWLPPRLTIAQAAEHAALAMKNFRNAVKLEPKNGLYHLGLASLLEQYVSFLAELAPETVPEDFRSLLLDHAKDSYYTAYDLSIREDARRRSLPLEGLQGLVAYEAGKAFLRLPLTDPALSRQHERQVAGIEKYLKRLEALPPGPITPIVFSFESHTCLSELLAPTGVVSFDLDGNGLAEQRPWVRPKTAILVWDPEHKGSITSGRQLFGSVSWWLFFQDGYHALDALDDNRDGQLSGPELLGISIWLDRNSNGRSDLGEVLPIQSTQIASLATRSTATDGDSPMNPQGLTLKDGRTMPTYDWVAKPPVNAPIASVRPAQSY